MSELFEASKLEAIHRTLLQIELIKKFGGNFEEGASMPFRFVYQTAEISALSHSIDSVGMCTYKLFGT